jgi:hypothetical protein
MSVVSVPTPAEPVPVVPDTRTGLSTAALVLGIVGVCVGLIPSSESSPPRSACSP